MNKREITQILNLNKQFYQFVSKDFSNTRQKPWKGWEGVLNEIEKREVREGLKVLDLGCGNGRFYEFLDKKIGNINYTGIDINNDLLCEAKKKFETEEKNNKKKVNFIKKDIFREIEKIKRKYDLVVAFGVTHHIPDKDFRTKWLSSLPKLVDKGGFLVLTFWEFEDKPGEYLLGWDNKLDTARYCYKYSNKEIGDIKAKYANLGLKLIGEYISDNKNRYLIFGNI